MINLARATAIRNFITVKRAYPWSFVFGRILSGFYIAAFSFFIYHYIFKNRLEDSFKFYTGSSDYMTFVVLGAAIYTFAVAILMNVGRSLMNELREGTIEPLLLSPLSRYGYFLGNLIEQLWRSLIEFSIILFVGWLFGAKFENINSIQFILVVIVSVLSFFSMGVALASIMLYTRDTYISQNTLFIIMSFICGISFPIQYLPVWLQKISQLLPVTSAVELFRKVIILHETIYQNPFLLIKLTFLCLIYCLSGFWWLRKIEKDLIEKNFG